MDDESTAAPAVQDAPADAPQEPVQDEQTAAQTPAVETEQETAPVETPAETPAEEEEEIPYQQGPGVPRLDFNNLPANDEGLIDPNALAQQINQASAQTFEAARIAARNEYQEQRAEEKSWDKAYEKYPDLKENKELRDLVHRARLGEVADLLSRSQDPQSVKLPTPSQVASKFFKNLTAAKADGMKQATENTVIQASAHVETAGRRTNDSSDTKSKLYQNINNPNKEAAKKARSELLKNMLFGG